MVVQRIDQDDEALGFVAAAEIHDRNAVEDDGVEFVRDLEIVGGRQRLRAEILE